MDELQISQKYRTWLDRKLGDQNGPAELLQHRTMNTAVAVLVAIKDIPFSKISSALYFFCSDLEMQDFAKLYEGQLELAGAAPDRFAKGLHKFFNEMERKIRKENLYREFYDFLSLSIRLRYQNMDTTEDIRVINCYQSLLLQNMIYLRPNKFDFTKTVCGISSDNKMLLIQEPYPYLDRPIYETERKTREGKIHSMAAIQEILQRTFSQAGMSEIKTMEDVEHYSNMDRTYTNHIAAMVPFINEYTFDIVPVKPYTCFVVPFYTLFVGSPSTEKLQEMLCRRSRTVPSNGVIFRFKDSDIIKKVLMKEILYDDKIYMLYRMETMFGDLSGYYDTQTGFMYSVLLDASDRVPYERVKNFLLYLYGCAVVKDGPKLLQNMPAVCYYAEEEYAMKRRPISGEMFGCGGKLQNVYDQTDRPEEGYGARKGSDKYESEERSIQGYIRKVGQGRTPSAQAVEYACALGYDLAPDETYVRPFIKRVLRLKEKQE